MDPPPNTPPQYELAVGQFHTTGRGSTDRLVGRWGGVQQGRSGREVRGRRIQWPREVRTSAGGGRDDSCRVGARARASGHEPPGGAGEGAPAVGPLPGDARAGAGVCAPAGDDAGGDGLVLSLSLLLSPNPNHSSLRGVFDTKYFKGWGPRSGPG